MTTKTVTVRLRAATTAYQAAMAKASATTKQLSRDITGVGDVADKDLKRISRGALLAAGGLAIGLGLSAKAAINWESAWAGVTKTVEGSEAQLDSLQEGLRGLAHELPATHAEIAGVAEVAGQLGVSTGGIEKFTDTMIDLGETTNLTAEQAATGLARFSNIMGTSERDVERMGSTIVELGNNSATTEAEILELGTRLAAAGEIAGLSEADVLAFAATLTSVGVEAEAGGTALSKVFTSIRDAVLTGGDDLETFAEVAGVTVDQFSGRFREDAAGAVALFVAGLGEMNESGRSTTQVFDDLGLADQRLMRALLSTATAGDLLTDSLDLAGTAWEENTALQTEAEQRYKTTAAQLEIARNKVVDFGIDIGSTLLPALNAALGLFGNFADGLASLPGPAAGGVAAVGGLSAALLGMLGIVGTLAPKFKAAKDALNSLGGPSMNLGNHLGKVAGAIGIATVAIGVGVLAYEQATRSSREYAEAVKELRGEMRGVIEGQSALNDVIDQFNADQVAELSENARQALIGFGITMGDVKDSVIAGGDALDPLRDKLDSVKSRFDLLADVDVGKLDDLRTSDAKEQLDELAEGLGMTRSGLEDLIESAEDWDDILQDAAQAEIEAAINLGELTQAEIEAAAAQAGLSEASENWLAVLEILRPSAAAVVEETKKFSSAAEVQADAIESVEDAISSMMDAFNNLIGIHISANEAQFDTIDGLATLQGALEENRETLEANGQTLDENTQLGRDNQRELNDRVGLIFSEIEARRNEGQAIGDVTAAALGHVEALKEEMRQVGFTDAEINGYIDSLNLTPDNIRTLVELSGISQAENALTHLARTRVARIVSDLTGMATNKHGGGFAKGAITSYAGGGIHAHVGSGDLIRYAEPETGGEAFIPRRGDPARSMPILQEAAGWYGASVIDRDNWASWTGTQLANGGGGSAPPPAPVRISFDTSGLPRDIATMLQERVRIDGGDAQAFFGRRR